MYPESYFIHLEFRCRHGNADLPQLLFQLDSSNSLRMTTDGDYFRNKKDQRIVSLEKRERKQYFCLLKAVG